MRVRPLLPGLAVGLVLALGGCGSDDDSTTSTGSTAAKVSTGAGPATSTATAAGDGVAITGTGYDTSVPAGWRDASELAEGTAFKIDKLYASPEGKTFKANVVIIREDPKALVGKRIEELEPQIRKQAAQAVGAPVPDPDQPTKLDGEDAVRWTLRRSQAGNDLIQRQLASLHDDALYTLTLTSTAQDDDGEAQLRTVVDGWHWK